VRTQRQAGAGQASEREAGRTSQRRAARALAALAVALGAASIAAPLPAQAAGVGQHTLAFSFGSAGGGTGQFLHPAGVAVSAASGEVYVSDRENNRVEEFAPVTSAGKLVGESYIGALAVPHPTAIAVDNCSVGATACSAAEDPSVGDVYVVGSKRRNSIEDDVLYKFNGAGAPVGEPFHLKKSPVIAALAVGSSGTLYVADEESLAPFSNAEVNVPEQTLPLGGAIGALALDDDGDLYAALPLQAAFYAGDSLVQAMVNEFGEVHREAYAGGSNPQVVTEVDSQTGEPLIGALDFELSVGVSVDTGAGGEPVYVLNEHQEGTGTTADVAVFGSGSEPPLGESTLAERHGELLQRLEATGLEGADAIAVDPAEGDDPADGAVFVVGGASDDVDVFAEAHGTPAPSAPEVRFSCESAAEAESPGEPCAPAASITTLEADVDPAGVPTKAWFEYASAGSCETGSCTRTAAVSIGDGSVETPVSAALAGLAPGLYHYRVVAEGEGSGPVPGAEGAFTVAGNASGLPDRREWEMVTPAEKGGAEPESITKEGGQIQAAAEGGALTYVADGPLPADVEPEGNREPETTQELSVREGGSWKTTDITTPNTTGAGVQPGSTREYVAFSPNLALALVEPFYATTTLASPPLSPPATTQEEGLQETTISLRADLPLAPQPLPGEGQEQFQEVEQDDEAAAENGVATGHAGYLALVGKLNQPGHEEAPEPPFGGKEKQLGLVVAAATPDLSHVAFLSMHAVPGIYEWGGAGHYSEARPPHKGQLIRELQLVSELPEGQRVPACESSCPEGASVGARAAAYGNSYDSRNMISNNGEFIFWTYQVKSGGYELYVHDSVIDKTLRIDAVQGEPQPGGAETAQAAFQTASAEGNRVFFTDTQRLTTNSTATKAAPQLYVFEPRVVECESSEGEEEKCLAGSLTDLTPEPEAHLLSTAQGSVEGAGVIGAAEDGSDVFFVANGALAPGATRGQCATPQATPRARQAGCGLYVVRHEASGWGAPQLVAMLSNEDSPDWDAADPGELKGLTARVSPNGEWLAFMSDRSLTGYDNEDATSKHPGERVDEEVYLYHVDAQPGEPSLVCASCNPTGARPHGVFDTGYPGPEYAEGRNLVVDRPLVWASNQHLGVDSWLAGSLPGWTNISEDRAFYQSRYLSDSGRLFFDSADALVPIAVPLRSESLGFEEAKVGVENVYEYEHDRLGSCSSEGGCVSLISSGTSEHESVFLDASENGEDVFFMTKATLSARDGDTNFDIYDAHVCEITCEVEGEVLPEGCEGEACQKLYSPASGFASLSTAAASGSGNVSRVEVLSSKSSKPPATKPLTRAQKLDRALKACRRQHRHSKHKRTACEKQARKRYGAAKHAKKKAGKRKSSGARS